MEGRTPPKRAKARMLSRTPLNPDGAEWLPGQRLVPERGHLGV
jgi:hypothetical protein